MQLLNKVEVFLIYSYLILAAQIMQKFIYTQQLVIFFQEKT